MQTNNTTPCKLLLILLVSLSGAGLVSCDKLLTVSPPVNEIAGDEVFSDRSLAVAAVADIYHKMIAHGYFEWGGLSYNTARSADEVVRNVPAYDFQLNTLRYTDYVVEYLWREGFISLLTINNCLEGLTAAHKLSPTLKRQLLGESLFCRAFVNYYLVGCWGDALPLVTTTNLEENQSAKSVPRQQVYDQIMTDLLQARDLLSIQYPSNGRARPNQLAADALLARLYLYQHRYNDAIATASNIIESKLYVPLPEPAAAFLLNSQEAIWQLIPATGGQALGAVADAGVYSDGHASLTPQLLAAFEPGDLRKQYWVGKATFRGRTFEIPYKYKDKGHNGNRSPTEYYIVLRLAEQYLIRAESNTRLGNTMAAIADLNSIRARAGLPDLPAALTQQACMAAVEQERRVELFTEWGHRWFDLKRWPGITSHNRTRADEVLGAIKPDWQPADQWYPVPQSELQRNEWLVQNPGYPPR